MNKVDITSAPDSHTAAMSLKVLLIHHNPQLRHATALFLFLTKQGMLCLLEGIQSISVLLVDASIVKGKARFFAFSIPYSLVTMFCQGCL